MKKLYNKPSIEGTVVDLRSHLLADSMPNANGGSANSGGAFGKEREEEADETNTAWDNGSLW